MPSIHPFKALRPVPEMAQLISSRSYDRNHNHISKSIIAENEHSFLHVVKPHLYFNDEERNPEKHFPYAKRKFDQLKEDKLMIKDEKACLYLHEITDRLKHNRYVGLVGLCSVDDYLNNKIKKHEHTLTKREDGIIQHVDAIKAVGEPVLLSFKGGHWFDEVVNKIMLTEFLYDFHSDDGLEHRIWKIEDENILSVIKSETSALDCFYIADGHHRLSACSRYAVQQREKGAKPDALSNFVLSYFIPDNFIKIFEFNRLVKDLNGFTLDRFIAKLQEHFDVYEIGKAKIRVKKKSFQFGFFAENRWFGLDFREHTKNWPVLERLDVSILEKYILNDLLGITDSKTDPRLSFLDGTKGIQALQDFVQSGKFACAFSLYPIKISDVFKVADEGLVMPPKSTWFEPKLRTGLLVHEF